MSVAIVGKLLGGLVVSGGGIAAITYMVINSSKNIYIYAISQGVVDNVAESSEDNITEYKCQFKNQDYPCKVSKVADFDDTTKQTYVDDPDMIDPKSANEKIVASELKQAGTIYKILIKSDIKDWTKNKFSIDITPKTDQSKKYASLKPLFAIKSGGLSDEYTKTEYFVVKKNEVSSASTGVTNETEESTPTHTCSTTEGETTPAEANNCNVYDFSNDTNIKDKTLHTLVFTKPGTPIADINSSTTNKYYLVKFNKSMTVSEVKQIKITPSGSAEPLQSKEIIPAIYTTEKADGVFILEKKSST